VDVTGTVDSVNFLNGAALDIAKGGVFDMLVDENAETNGSVINSGLIEKTAGTGVSYIQGDLTSTGTITAATGTIDFQYAANSTIGGTVSGAGTVYFVSGGNYTIEAGTKFTVATLGLYGNFVFDGNVGYARPEWPQAHLVRTRRAQRHGGRRRHADHWAQDHRLHQRPYARRNDSAERCRHAGQ
jgi:hypothetical protein